MAEISCIQECPCKIGTCSSLQFEVVSKAATPLSESILYEVDSEEGAVPEFFEINTVTTDIHLYDDQHRKRSPCRCLENKTAPDSFE